MKKPNEAPPTVVRQRDDDNPLGSGYHLNVTGKRLLLRIHYLFVIGLLCFNSKASVAKKKFRNVHRRVMFVELELVTYNLICIYILFLFFCSIFFLGYVSDICAEG